MWFGCGSGCWDWWLIGCWIVCWIVICLFREGWLSFGLVGEVVGGEEGEFFGVGWVIEDWIVMGKVFEVVDDFVMFMSVGEEGLVEFVV